MQTQHTCAPRGQGTPVPSSAAITLHNIEPARPLHPGQILVEDFMRPQKISGRALACALHVSHTRIACIMRGASAISADTALRLAHYFDTSPWFWLNLQMRYELEMADRQEPHATDRIVPLPSFMDPGTRAVPDDKEWCMW